MRVDVTAHARPRSARRARTSSSTTSQQSRRRRPSFVRTGPTKAGHYLFWESGCIFVTLDADGTKEIAGDAEFPVIDDVDRDVEHDADTPSCSYMKMIEHGPARRREVGNDGINLIKFRDASWCRPAVDDDPARCYSTVGRRHHDRDRTSTTASSARDGAIVDADIEINGVNFAISVDGVTLGTAAVPAPSSRTR